MAALGSQTIAASYEQLLHVDTDGGGDTTTLVPIKDGDNGTTFCLQLATTSALIVDDAKLYFGTGSDAYIEYDEDGTDTWDFSPPAGGMKILDDKKLVFGTDSDASFEYDEDGADNLSIAGADVSIANGIGLIVGNTAQVAMGEVTSEVQILGTTETDACLAIGLASTTDALSPSLKFVKGAHATIGNHSVTVADNEELGKIQAYGSDATDSDTLSSEIAFNIDDDGVGTGTLGGEILLKTSGTDGTLDTAVTIDNSQNVTIAGNLSVTGTSPGVSSIEMFYYGYNGAPFDMYAALGAIEDNSSVYMSGIAPTGFSSMGAMYVWWIKTQDSSNGLNLQTSWDMASDGQAYAIHTQSDVELTEADAGEDFDQGKVYRSEIGQDITLDSSVAAGDVFGISIKNTGPDNCYVIGISIVWAF
mgnify:CR=1 FL=1|jgi:hypothetical protein